MNNPDTWLAPTAAIGGVRPQPWPSLIETKLRESIGAALQENPK